MSDLKKFIQAQQFQLAGSGVSLSDTSIILKSFKLPNSQALITNSDLGTINYATLEGGTAREEAISFTGVTQNADGTATITGVTRGLKFVAPYDQDLSLRDGHGGGTSFVITNGPGFYNEFTSKVNDETIEQLWSFIQNPQKTSDTLAANNRDFVTKNDLIAAALGTVAITGTVQSGTSGEAIAVGKVCYLKVADNRWWKADAATPATFDGVQLGIAQTAAGSAGVGLNILPFGIDVNQSGLTPGARYYLSDTAGNISATAGTNSVFLGWALTSTNFLFARNNDIQGPTAKEKAAMVGTSGTPSASNKFVTDADTAENTASKLVRRKSDGNVSVPTTPSAGTDAVSKTYSDLNIMVYKNGVSSRGISTASGTQTIAHGLGRVPKRVFIRADWLGAASNQQNGLAGPGASSTGVYNGATTATVAVTGAGNNGQGGTIGTSTTDIISIVYIGNGGGGGSQTATITVDATNITLTWTLAGFLSGAASLHFMWEAQG